MCTGVVEGKLGGRTAPISRYALGFGAGAERAGAEAAELYAGEKEDDLNERVVTFFRKELSHRVRPGCKETMDKHKSDGVRCVMCTSSWQHPARAAAALYGLEPDPKDVISSVMEVDPLSGVLTGKIQKWRTGTVSAWLRRSGRTPTTST